MKISYGTVLCFFSRNSSTVLRFRSFTSGAITSQFMIFIILYTENFHKVYFFYYVKQKKIRRSCSMIRRTRTQITKSDYIFARNENEPLHRYFPLSRKNDATSDRKS